MNTALLSMVFCTLGVSSAMLIELQLIVCYIGIYVGVLSFGDKNVMCHVAIDVLLVTIHLILGIIMMLLEERNYSILSIKRVAQSIARVAKKVATPILLLQFIVVSEYESNLHLFDPHFRETEVGTFLSYSCSVPLFIMFCLVFTEFVLCPETR